MMWNKSIATVAPIRSMETSDFFSDEPQNLAALHDQFYPLVYRYVRYRLEDEQAVEDITAEVFLRLLDAIQKRRGSVRDVRAWLMGTASHLINDHLRHKYSRPEDNLDDYEHLRSDDTPEALLELAQKQRKVRRAYSRLTAEQQQVLALRFSMDFSLEETAKSVKKSVNAVKVLQFRALASLRKHLAEEGSL